MNLETAIAVTHLAQPAGHLAFAPITKTQNNPQITQTGADLETAVSRVE